MRARWRPVWLAIAAVVAIWIVALAGYGIAKRSQVTAEKVRAYAQSLDLTRMTPEERARALKKLSDQINALSLEERQQARMEGSAWQLFGQLTEEEKSSFIEATMPSGFKQMLVAFEEMPEEKRKRAIDDSLRRLRETRQRVQVSPGARMMGVTNNEPALSPELQAKIRTIGLKSFYSESSAQTKAELAPVLEELQRVMQSGRHFRR